MNCRLLVICVCIAAISAAGCQKQEVEAEPAYQTLPGDPQRNTELAREHNARAIDFINRNELTAAEAELRAALEADVFFGPAHNNLGMVYYRQQRFYLAAWEFQYATKLMPKKSEPLNNLGLVLEAVGKLDDAARTYDEALAIDADSVEATANLARVSIRTGRRDDRTRQLLQEIVLKDDRPEWVQWAREQLSKQPNSLYE